MRRAPSIPDAAHDPKDRAVLEAGLTADWGTISAGWGLNVLIHTEDRVGHTSSAAASSSAEPIEGHHHLLTLTIPNAAFATNFELELLAVVTSLPAFLQLGPLLAATAAGLATLLIALSTAIPPFFPLFYSFLPSS